MKGLLNKILALSNNIEPIEGTGELPSHLIAHGQIVVGEHRIPIATAIAPATEEQVEFSTNIGQLPNTSLGAAITDRLNHSFDGKFVLFETEEDKSLDLVYTTALPIKVLDRETLNSELEEHAKVKVAIEPILSSSFLPDIPASQQPRYSKIMTIAQDIVDLGLNLQSRLQDIRVPIEYLGTAPDTNEPK